MRFEDRLAIVALALLEGPTPQRVDGLRPGSLEARALERLEVVPDGRRVREALQSAGAWPRSAMRVIIAVVVLIVAMGLAAVVSGTSTVSVPAVLVGTLGVQTLLLAAWIASLVPGVGGVVRRVFARVVAGPMRTIGAIGGGLAEAIPGPTQALRDWTDRRRRAIEMDRAAAIAATSALAMAYAPKRSVMAALVYGVWSNAAWVAANVIVLALLSLRLLGSRNYTLHSGLLSPEVTREWVEAAVRVLSHLVPGAWLPDADAMARAAAEPAGVATDSWKWGAMLVASVGVFGLLPRLGALALSLAWLPAARRRWRIPWDEPALAATRAVIEASRPPQTVVAREGPDARRAAGGAPDLGTQAATVGSSPAIVRIGAVTAWTPGRPTIELGTLDASGLDGAEAVAARVRAERLAPVIVLIDLTVAPRRGMTDYLAPVALACGGALCAVLSEGSRLRRSLRARDMALVVDSWRSLLAETGFGMVIEVDLALRTSRSGSRLESLLTGHSVAAAPAGVLDRAFQRIVDFDRELGERVPGAAEERHLLDSLGALHGAEALTARAPFVCAIGDAEHAWWKPGVDMARLAATGGPRLGEATLGASLRQALAFNAMLVAIELDRQGCGEVSITAAWERAGAIVEETAVPGMATDLATVLRRVAESLRLAPATTEARA